jgi:tRNA(Ile)-lysidine synthase TilS/MesJ
MSGKQSICAFCSRMKRGVLYSCLRREGYNVLALGQHLDDLCESLLMSIFHNGSLRTMKANYHVESGDLRIIRPLCYVRERFTREYANLSNLPVVNENCPACFEAPKERQRCKVMLAAQEHIHQNLYQNMLQLEKKKKINKLINYEIYWINFCDIGSIVNLQSSHLIAIFLQIFFYLTFYYCFPFLYFFF